VSKVRGSRKSKVLAGMKAKSFRPKGERRQRIAEWLRDNFQAESIYFYRLAGLTGFLVVFGLVMVLNLMIGLLHPPMGMVLFVLARVAKLSVERTTIAILPWLFPLIGSLAIITYVPSLVLWLPKQFY